MAQAQFNLGLFAEEGRAPAHTSMVGRPLGTAIGGRAAVSADASEATTVAAAGEPDLAAALGWYDLAASLGHAGALVNLAAMYVRRLARSRATGVHGWWTGV